MLASLNWCRGIALAVALACALDCPRAAAWQASPGLPDLSTFSIPERQMIESACRRDRQNSGPAYSNCVRQQVDALHASPGSPDLSAISSDERQMMESACRPDRQMGPAAYYRCLREQVDALHASPGGPDLSAISSADQQKMESACHLDRQMSGPAAYYRCLRKQVEALSADRLSKPESQTRSAKTPPQGSPSRQSKGHSHGPTVPSSSAGAASSPPAVGNSGPDSISTNSNRRVLTAWLAGLFAIFVIGFSAKILYDRVNPKKCGRCGTPTKTRGAYCDACLAAMEESQRRASEQRAAEQRAKDEAEHYAREQWKLEESRRISVLDELHRLTGPQFEDLIASLFRKDGYTVGYCGGNGDEGIDLVLEMGEEKDVVQCKPGKSDIESPVVREFYGALMHAAARHGFIVTSASFNQGARDFARGKPISLISAAEILQWIDGTYSARDLAATRPNAKNDGKAFDPYAVLGIGRDASPEEIRAAYRREMVNYHPDKVAHLGKEFQELAKTKAQEINRAYEQLAHSQ